MAIWRNDKLQGVKLHQTNPVKRQTEELGRMHGRAKQQKTTKYAVVFLFCYWRERFCSMCKYKCLYTFGLRSLHLSESSVASQQMVKLAITGSTP